MADLVGEVVMVEVEPQCLGQIGKYQRIHTDGGGGGMGTRSLEVAVGSRLRM